MKQILWCAVAALAVAGCGKNESKVEDGILIYARGADAKSLDPQSIDDGESVVVVSQMFDTLVQFEAKGTKVEPALATSWSASADGKTWTFKLRGGVKFHDGSALDGPVVAANFDRYLNASSPLRAGVSKRPYDFLYTNIAKVEATGTDTVQFTLLEANATFLTNLAMFPASISSTAAMGKWKESYGEHPVGTGAFRFVSWEAKQKIVLEANAEYWGGAPKSKKLIIAVIPDNPVRVQRLRAGEVHIVDGVSPEDHTAIRGDANCRLLIEPGMNFGYLAINTEKPPFDRAEVRQAIAMALDKGEINKLAYLGTAQTGPNALPPTMWGYNDKVEEYPYDPGKAKAVIAAAGIAGKEIDLYVMSNPRPYVPNPKNVGAILVQRLEAIGLKPRILSPEWKVYLDDLKAGKHDIALVGWSTDNGDPDNFLFTLFHSSAIPEQNSARYRSKEFDALVEQAQREPEQSKRAELYRKAQEVMHRDSPVIPIAYMPNVAAMRANVEGYSLHPMGLVRLKDTFVKK
ncbi:MAG: peptide/nickel transport system substrate-binding [Planctomycetota bacterium]|nr:MAG: peptide/nickel transport system substrate-binding [Planctomycetota bacterium]